MAADDLRKPLGGARGGGRPPGWRRIAVVAGITALAVALMAGLFHLRTAPGGGEPVAVISLNGPQTRAAGDEGDAFAMRDSVDPDDEEAQAGAGAAPDMADDDGVVRITMLDGAEMLDESGASAGPPDIDDSAAQPVPRTQDGEVALAAAPDPGLIERAKVGLLPRIGSDGRRPAQVYARPATQSGTSPSGDTPARVAIIVTALGISARSTDQAIKSLPGEISLAFAPYGSDLQDWVDRARGDGHEVLLQLPMEPFDYPDNDPGPHTMLADAASADNLRKLHWLLAQVTGYFAVTNYMGARFTSTQRALTPVLEEVGDRGLVYVDDGSSPRSQADKVAQSLGLQTGVADVILDAGQTRASIDKALERLEAMARERGFAVGTATALPGTLEALAAWSRQAGSRGIQLVPVSALVSGAPRS